MEGHVEGDATTRELIVNAFAAVTPAAALVAWNMLDICILMHTISVSFTYSRINQISKPLTQSIESFCFMCNACQKHKRLKSVIKSIKF